MATRPINPTVHIPEEGTYYYRSFWGSYKGHAMGLVRGVLTGSVLGLVTGATVLVATATLGIGIAAALPVLAYFVGAGSLLGAGIMGSAGHAAGAAAAATAEEELRLRYPGSGDGITNSIESPLTGDGHHYEAEGRKPKLFHWNVGLPMGALFATVGAVLAFGILAAAAPAGLGALGLHGLAGLIVGTAGHAAAGSAAGIAATAGIGAVFGASFGVDRGNFKNLFNHTDEWLNGKLMRNKSKVTLQQEMSQELTKEAAEGKAKPVITTLERQDEFHRLYYDYLEKTFWNAISGNMRGFLGGGVIGGVIGVALGAAVAAAIPTLAIPIILAGAALGAHEGIAIFTRAGIDGGAQAAAKEALEVKRQRLQKGLDPERDPHEPNKTRLLSPRSMMAGIVAGVIGGVVMGPIAGLALSQVLGITTATTGLLGGLAASFNASFAGLVGTAAAHGIPHLGASLVGGTVASGVMGAAIGASSGLGLPAYKGIAAISDSFYAGGIVRGEIGKEVHHRRIPYLAPNSSWVPRDETLQRTTEKFSIPHYDSPLLNIGARDLSRGQSTVLASPQATTLTQPIAEAAAVTAPVQAQPAREPVAEIASTPARPYPTTQPLTQRIQHIIAERNTGTNASAVDSEERRRTAPVVQTGQVL